MVATIEALKTLQRDIEAGHSQVSSAYKAGDMDRANYLAVWTMNKEKTQTRLASEMEARGETVDWNVVQG